MGMCRVGTLNIIISEVVGNVRARETVYRGLRVCAKALSGCIKRLIFGGRPHDQ